MEHIKKIRKRLNNLQQSIGRNQAVDVDQGNQIKGLEQTVADLAGLVDELADAVEILEDAREVQIKINTKLLREHEEPVTTTTTKTPTFDFFHWLTGKK